MVIAQMAHDSAARDIIRELRAENERLRAPFQAADAKDWEHLFVMLPESGHGRFWKTVMYEMRAALEQTSPEMESGGG